ncbi:DUF4238 domain-containing protein [Actinomadura monticuli]|uniref:DUF4238 domain-containing protein n=1 Tax=Actinomadura monticuli TaxID=3097367 RepID=A0ABV4QLE9_9ACTN
MKKIQKLKRRHHTVPRFHLKRFANEHGRLIRVALPGDKSHPISVNDATVEKDFYLLEDEQGTQSDALEDLLSEVEGNAAKGVRNIVDEHIWPITGKTRESVAAWAASQALRTTSQRQSSSEIADIMLKMQIGIGGKPQVRHVLRDRLGREPTDSEVATNWATLSNFDSYAVESHPHNHLKIMLSLWPDTTAMFCARGWTVVRFERKALITCDAPVYLAPAPDHPEWAGIGLATAGTILVPLDRRVALLMGEVGAPDARAAGTTLLYKQYNQALAWNARTAIFHHPNDPLFDGLELPEPKKRIMGGYDQVKDLIFPEGIGARFKAANTKAATPQADTDA